VQIAKINISFGTCVPTYTIDPVVVIDSSQLLGQGRKSVAHSVPRNVDAEIVVENRTEPHAVNVVRFIAREDLPDNGGYQTWPEGSQRWFWLRSFRNPLAFVPVWILWS
jgi:hypothetical protein